MKKILSSILAASMLFASFGVTSYAATEEIDFTVTTSEELQSAVNTAEKGDTILLKEGEYDGFDFEGNGKAARDNEINFIGEGNVKINCGGDNYLFLPYFTGTFENIVFFDGGVTVNQQWKALIYAEDTWSGYACDLTFINCDFITTGEGNSGIMFGGDADFYGCDFKGSEGSYSAFNYCCPQGDGIVIEDCTFTGDYSFASIHLAEGVAVDVEITGCEIKTGLVEFGSPDEITFTENEIDTTVNLWGKNNVDFVSNNFGANAKVAANVEGSVVLLDNSNTYAEGKTANDVIVSGDDIEGTIKTPVAQIGTTGYYSFEEAYKAAQTGDIIELVDGTYEMPGSLRKDITIKGSRNVIIDNVGAYGTNASLTFDGITIDFMPNVNYTGFQHSNVMTYNNVQIVGQQFLYGEKEIFNNCEFVQESSDAYNVWTYGAKYVEFNNCKFTSAGKSVLVYSEQESAKTDLEIVDCDFIATTPVEGKAAIEIDSSYLSAENGYSINIDGETTATGFATGSDSGSTLWNDKKVNAGTSGNTVVIVDDKVVHANIKNADEDTVAVAVVDGKAYTDMADAIAAIKNDSNVNILAGTYSEKLEITEENVTVKATGDVKFTTIPMLKGTNWYVEGIDFEYESSYNDINTSGTLKDCTFTSDKDALRYCYGKANSTLVIDGCTFNAGNVMNNWAIHFDDAAKSDIVIKNSVFNGRFALPGTVNSVSVSNTEITGYYANIWGAAEGISYEKTTFDVNYIYVGEGDTIATFDNCKSVNEGESIMDLLDSDSYSATVIVDGKVETKDAKIVNDDGTIDYYNTLEDAVNGAAGGSTIDLMGNTVEFPEVKTIAKEVKIVNGTISLNPATATFASMRAATVVPHWLITGKVVFENVTLVGEDYNTDGWGLFYFATDDASVTFVDSSISLKNDTANGGLAKGEGSTDYVTFNNTDGYFENTGRGFTNIKKVTLINDSDLVFKGTTADGLENAFNMSGLEIKDTSSVEIDGCSEYGIKISEDVKVDGDGALLVVRNSGIADITERTDATGNPALRANAGGRVYADIIDSNVWVVENVGGKVVATSNNIWVQYKKVAETEESVKYDIVLSGYKNNINRLTTADLTFDFDPVDTGIYENSNLDYEITPATGITLTPKGENRYMFNFDGITQPDESGVNIVIGQVTITGFGTFTFKVDDSDVANATNLVNATEVEDNIVDSFVPGGAENKGTLVLNTVMDGNDDMVETIVGEIKIPTRTLTINIQFPNKVNYNAATYQDMTVTVKGGQYEEVINLGNVANLANGGYQIALADLPYNTTYTVTVEGAGYRTARYSVVMTDNKVLNFWNNVKSGHNAMEIEEGVSALTTKNFLAGDIVKDNTINIWDLNAVVSFFGQNAKEDAAKYVRYDLNRDGKIDSKDVAYVLVSWGE